MTSLYKYALLLLIAGSASAVRSETKDLSANHESLAIRNVAPTEGLDSG